MKNNFDPYKFNLQTTSPDIPHPCINALMGSLRRNCIARIQKLLSSKYDLETNTSRTPFADTRKASLLFVVNFRISTTSSPRAFESESIRLDARHGFIVRAHHYGLTSDIPAVKLSTDSLYQIEQSLTCEHHPF